MRCHPGTYVGQTRLAASPCGVASDRVYICTQLPAVPVSSYLAFPSLPLARRSISVALSRRSPSADVIRYPALRSPDFPHADTFRQHSARSYRLVIFYYTHFRENVNRKARIGSRFRQSALSSGNLPLPRASFNLRKSIGAAPAYDKPPNLTQRSPAAHSAHRTAACTVPAEPGISFPIMEQHTAKRIESRRSVHFIAEQERRL